MASKNMSLPQADDEPHDHGEHEHGGHEHGGHEHGGHEHGGHEHGGHAESFRRLFWWNLALSVPIVLTSRMIMDWFGYDLELPGVRWVGPVLGTVVFLWGGRPFLDGGRDELRARRPGMMLLIAMAITVAYLASMATSLGFFDLDFWWELAALVVVMLLGHWQEMRALGRARGALTALAELLPDEAELIEGDDARTVPISDLSVEDTVLVRSGGRVPADGEIVSGRAELDESMITGESRPVARGEGEPVVAGTVATDSSIRVRITAVGEDTALGGIRRLVAEAESSRSRSQVLADRAAALLFYVAVAAAVVTAVVWLVVGDADQAVTRVVTVLVISCPHALGLAIPLTTSLSSAVAADAGILIKDQLALERSRRCDIFLFDKTGTLTLGQHRVVEVAGTADLDEDEVLSLTAAVEGDSEHPLARAIVDAARVRGEVPRAVEFRSSAGRGVEARIEGVTHAVGGPTLLRERSIAEPDELAEDIARWRERGASVLFLLRGDAEVLGALALEDRVRPEARETVRGLRAEGHRVVLITGDARQVADTVAAELGIEEVLAEVLPEDKADEVAELQEGGVSVAMIGDGVNDAPALARADVGIAIGAGTDVAMESAGLILAGSDPRGVLGIVRLSRAAYRKSLQNLWWAGGYNIVAIPLAAGALQWAGITMPPALGAVLMSLSTIVVAANAQLLRRVDLRPDEHVDRPDGERLDEFADAA